MFLYLALQCVAPAPGAEGPLIGLRAGVANLWDTDRDVGIVAMDYRFRPFGSWRVVPATGILAGEDGAYIFFGDLQRNFWVHENAGATFFGGAGIFHCGRILDLDFPVEFRMGMEVFYRTSSNSRIGLRYSHMSNAGFGDTNPSTEAVLLSWSIALDHGGRRAGTPALRAR